MSLCLPLCPTRLGKHFNSDGTICWQPCATYISVACWCLLGLWGVTYNIHGWAMFVRKSPWRCVAFPSPYSSPLLSLPLPPLSSTTNAAHNGFLSLVIVFFVSCDFMCSVFCVCVCVCLYFLLSIVLIAAFDCEINYILHVVGLLVRLATKEPGFNGYVAVKANKMRINLCMWCLMLFSWFLL